MVADSKRTDRLFLEDPVALCPIAEHLLKCKIEQFIITKPQTWHKIEQLLMEEHSPLGKVEQFRTEEYLLSHKIG